MSNADRINAMKSQEALDLVTANKIDTAKSVQVAEVNGSWYVLLCLPTGVKQKTFTSKQDALDFKRKAEDYIATVVYHAANVLWGN